MSKPESAGELRLVVSNNIALHNRGWFIAAGGAAVLIAAALWWRIHGHSPAPAISARIASPAPQPSGPVFPKPLPTVASSSDFLKTVAAASSLTDSIGVGLGSPQMRPESPPPDPEVPIFSPLPVSKIWGQRGMGLGPIRYTSRWAWFHHLYRRFENNLCGELWPVAGTISMDDAMRQYALFERLFPSPTFTIYYAPGMDGATIQLHAILGTNGPASKNATVRRTLKELLALNGYTLVRLRPDVVKVFPTKRAAEYGPEVID